GAGGEGGRKGEAAGGGRAHTQRATAVHVPVECRGKLGRTFTADDDLLVVVRMLLGADAERAAYKRKSAVAADNDARSEQHLIAGVARAKAHSAGASVALNEVGDGSAQCSHRRPAGATLH